MTTGRLRRPHLVRVFIAIGALLAGTVTVIQAPGAVAQSPAPTYTGATLFLQSPAPTAPGAVAQPPVYVDDAHGWYLDRVEGNRDIEASNPYGSGPYHSWSFLIHATHPVAGQRIEIGISCSSALCASGTDAIVRDAQVAPDGTLTRFDAVFAAPVFYGPWQNGGYLSGELSINEPVAALQSNPRELFFPPTGRQSTTATYPVRLTSTVTTSAHVARLALTGTGARYFRLSSDSCTGATLTSGQDCGVDVTYLPHAAEDAATLVATDSAGHTIATTPLDAGLLPGASYWAALDHNIPDGYAVLATGSIDPITAFVSSPTQPSASYSIDITLGFPGVGTDASGWFTIDSDRPLVPGVYRVAGNPHLHVDYDLDSGDSPVVGGVIRITQLVAGTRSRGIDQINQLALTYVLRKADDRRPVYGSFGLNTDVPLRIPGQTSLSRYGDFDGDGRTDIAVYRPSTHQWFVRGHPPVTYGLAGDVPEPGDYDGNGASDIAVYRPSTHQWFVRGHPPVTYGLAGDVPERGDYDGDGRTDVAVYRPSTHQWFVRGHATVSWGRVGDVPVPADYTGDGATDVAVYRPSTADWYLYGSGGVHWGEPGDVPVPGDYGPEPLGAAAFAVWRPATGAWLENGAGPVTYGLPHDVPVPGAYGFDVAVLGGNDRDETDEALFRPSTDVWYVTDGVSRTAVQWGRPGDVPV